ncbi:MAG: hypothetical protein ABIG89_03920 [Candidatus Woesearchaeota archaeon]
MFCIVLAFLIFSACASAGNFSGWAAAKDEININEDTLTFLPHTTKDNTEHDELLIKSRRYGFETIKINNTLYFFDYKITYLNKTFIEGNDTDPKWIKSNLPYKYNITIDTIKPDISASKTLINEESNLILGGDIKFKINFNNKGEKFGYVKYEEELPYYYKIKGDLTYETYSEADDSEKIIRTFKQNDLKKIQWSGMINNNDEINIFFTLVPTEYMENKIISTNTAYYTYGNYEIFTKTIDAMNLTLKPLLTTTINLDKENYKINDNIKGTITINSNFADEFIKINNFNVFFPDTIKIKSISDKLNYISVESEYYNYNKYSWKGTLPASTSKSFEFDAELVKLGNQTINITSDWNYGNAKYTGELKKGFRLNSKFEGIIPKIEFNKINVSSGNKFTVTLYLKNKENTAIYALAYLKSNLFDEQEFMPAIKANQNRTVKTFIFEAPQVFEDKIFDVTFKGTYLSEDGTEHKFSTTEKITILNNDLMNRFNITYKTGEFSGKGNPITININAINEPFPNEITLTTLAYNIDSTENIKGEEYQTLLSNGFQKTVIANIIGSNKIELKNIIKYSENGKTNYDTFEKTYLIKNNSLIDVTGIEDEIFNKDEKTTEVIKTNISDSENNIIAIRQRQFVCNNNNECSFRYINENESDKNESSELSMDNKTISSDEFKKSEKMSQLEKPDFFSYNFKDINIKLIMDNIKKYFFDLDNVLFFLLFLIVFFEMYYIITKYHIDKHLKK